MMETPTGFEDRADYYFCWLLNQVMPWRGGYAVVLVAYFDASAREGGAFCVAGFAFHAGPARRATVAWARLWSDTHCHMTDLHTRKAGVFAGWTAKQAGERLIASVPIINGHAAFGVAVSCDVAELARLAPAAADPGSAVILDGLRLAYPLCCHMAMTAMGELVAARNPAGDIAYFFEQGDLHQPESQRFTGWMSHAPLARELYRLRSHTVLAKADARLFEMADIFAWEWAKHVERAGEGLGMRPSLAALLKVSEGESSPTQFKSKTRRGMHLTGAALEQFFRRAAEFGVFRD